MACLTSVLSLDWGHDAETPKPRYERFCLAYPSGTVEGARWKARLPWYAMRRTEPANRPLICAQAFGEALDPDRLERLGRCDLDPEEVDTVEFALN